MTLVGSDVEYLSPMQDRKAAASHIIISDYQCFFWLRLLIISNSLYCNSIFETFASYEKVFYVLGYSFIPRLKIFRPSGDPLFLRSIIQFNISRYRFLQLARFANLAACSGISRWFKR